MGVWRGKEITCGYMKIMWEDGRLGMLCTWVAVVIEEAWELEDVWCGASLCGNEVQQRRRWQDELMERKGTWKWRTRRRAVAVVKFSLGLIQCYNDRTVN